MSPLLLAVALMTTPAPNSHVMTPWFTGPGHWFPLPVVLKTAESDKLTACVKPQVTFQLEGHDLAPMVRHPYELCGRPMAGFGADHMRPTGSLVQAPDAPGTYRVEILMQRGPRVVSQAATRSVTVLPLPLYVAAMLAIFLALLAAGWVLVVTRNPRLKWSIVGALALTSPLWFPQLMGGHTLFLVVMAVVARFYAKGRGASAFLLSASCLVAAFLELYWGSVTSNANWTAWVLSITLLWVIYRLIRLVIRQQGRLAIVIWCGTMTLALIDVSQAIYKSFFLDYGSVSIMGTTGQLGQLMDSIGRVVTFTHVMSLLIPLSLPVLALALRRQSSATMRPSSPVATA